MNRSTGQLIVVAGVIVILVGLAFLWNNGNNQAPPEGPASTQPEGKPSSADSSPHLAMGNPSGATDDPAHPDNFLMRKPYYALSYNNAKGTPNWVSWRLQEDDFGNEGRDEFYPDPDLPPTFKHVRPNDYTGSGFDRGHMCPERDRNGSKEASHAVFAMTNIIPQSPHCNQFGWRDFEYYCHDLVKKKHQTLYIISGPQGQGGEGKEGPKDVIGRADKVTVPAKCWKVVLTLDHGKGDSSDVNRVNRDSRVFAVVMPNDQSVGRGWEKYQATVKQVEELTGYHFFDRVPNSIIGPLKEQGDREHNPAERHRKED